jgi:hypothetical protein
VPHTFLNARFEFDETAAIGKDPEAKDSEAYTCSVGKTTPLKV